MINKFIKIISNIFKEKAKVRNKYRVVKITTNGYVRYQGQLNGIDSVGGWAPMYHGTCNTLDEAISVINQRKAQDAIWENETKEVVYV